MSVISLNKIPTLAEAQKIVKELAESGMVSFSSHALKRMRERKINTQQVLTCLIKGKIVENPVLANKGGDEAGYEVTVERSVAGEPLRVCACLRFTQTLLVVTVMKITKL